MTRISLLGRRAPRPAGGVRGARIRRLAQTAAPTPPSSVDARTEAQKSAFLAMPEADRKAVQDALGWLGLYNGAVDGAFGKRTRNSILAYQGSVNATADGVVSAPQLAALKAAAQKARAAVGFELIDERRSGVRIGAPLKILDKIAMIGGGRRDREGGRQRDLGDASIGPARTPISPPSTRKLIADATGRKITYKAMKADEFFVVAGEEAGRKFYSRFAKPPANWPDGPSLRGFTFSYPKTQAADLDKVALAIANSFEPFSSSPASLERRPRAATSTLTWRDIVKVAPVERGRPAGAAERDRRCERQGAAERARNDGDRSDRRPRAGADRDRRGRMRQTDRRWQAREKPARGRRDRAHAARRRFWRGRAAAELWRRVRRASRAQRRAGRDAGDDDARSERRDADAGRRGAAGNSRGADEKRERRAGVRSQGRPGGARRADQG